MSDFNNNNSNTQCNYCRNLNPSNITITTEEINNNVININNLERSNSNTIVIIKQYNRGASSTESHSDKTDQTTPEDFEDPEDIIGDETTDMGEDRHNYNAQYDEDIGVIRAKAIQANGNKPIPLTHYTAYYNNINDDDANDKATDMTYDRNIMEHNRNIMEHQRYLAENEQYEEENKTIDVPILNNSPINEILSHSQRNKALINSVLKNFSSEPKANPIKFNPTIFPDKNLNNQSALKNMFDIIRWEKSKINENKKFTIDSFTQTVSVTMEDKNTQTIAKGPVASTKGNNKKRNCDVGPVAKDLNSFLQQSVKYFDDYQKKQKQLIQQYNIQLEDVDDKFGRNCVDLSYNGNAGFNVNNTPNPVNSISIGNSGITANGKHPDFVGSANPAYSGNAGFPVNSAGAGNESRLFNTVNPMPRQMATSRSERTTPPRPPRPYSVNPTVQVRGVGRPRTNASASTRFSPYPRLPMWQQPDAAQYRRPTPQVLEYEDANAIPYPPNTMMAQYNGWQVPNPPNPQTFFPTPPHHPF